MPVSFKAKRYCYGPDERIGYACTIGLTPWTGVIGAGDTPASALHMAAGIAGELQEQLARHPELAAVLPPGTGAALKGLALASKALASGHAVEDIAKNIGPATAALASRVLALF